MPYYCTVPKCTSMAGKVKNVSFHQFPRDEELAKRWNEILKRGKPYTKYSKVCSLHFKPDDYTMTSVGKNKGQWRTLRKNAIPSQNLPSDCPMTFRSGTSESSSPSQSGAPIMDPQVQQQLAQAIYMHTMLAMQAAELTKRNEHSDKDPGNSDLSIQIPTDSKENINKIKIEKLSPHPEDLITLEDILSTNKNLPVDQGHLEKNFQSDNFKCKECSKCFKDPDVFILHRRGHAKNKQKDSDEENIFKRDEILFKTEELFLKKEDDLEKKEMLLKKDENVPKTEENFLKTEGKVFKNINMPNNSKGSDQKQDTLKANPILANLLNSSNENNLKNIQDLNLAVNTSLYSASDLLSMENQVMAAMALNLEAYMRNLNSLISANNNSTNSLGNRNPENILPSNSNAQNNAYYNLVNKHSGNFNPEKFLRNCNMHNIFPLNCTLGNNLLGNSIQIGNSQNNFKLESNGKSSPINDLSGNLKIEKRIGCDKQDLNDTIESDSLVEDET